MDEAGFHARRRAEKESRLPHAALADATPMNEAFNSLDISNKVEVPEPEGSTGYAVANYRPPPAVDANEIPGASSTTEKKEGLQGAVSAAGPHKDDPAAQATKMSPHVQFMCGPMLRYDTVEAGTWHGFAMMVTLDSGSDYSRRPRITLRYGSNETEQEAVQIFQYHSLHGSNTFWRFKIEVPLADREQPVRYAINGGHDLQFWVPGKTQNMRWMAHSCNGFSAGVDTDAFNGPDPLWNDFLELHQKQPFHAVVGGGDQIYNDKISGEPELSEWLQSSDAKFKEHYVLTDEMKFAIDRFFFNNYVNWFRNGAFARAIACVPMVNVLDDHDLIDGFGSYPDELLTSPVFSTIGARGFFWYSLFQNFIVDEVDGTSAEPGSHTFKSCIIGGEGTFVPTPSHSFLSYLGPDQSILLMDCRAERKLNRVCTELTYKRCFDRVRQVKGIKQLTILLGVPIAYPRMVFAENMLGSKFNPITAIAKTGALGLGGFVNKFNGQAELLDDMNDHWCASAHKKERNWLVEQCQALAKELSLRVTFLSGDVHAAAVGRFFSKTEKKPEQDPKYMLNIISSAIVNTPPPPAVIGMMNRLGKKTHKTLHYADTAEDMVEMWKEDTDGTKQKQALILGRRNYCTAEIDEQTKDLIWTFRVEKSQGEGKSVPYPVRAPAPHY